TRRTAKGTEPIVCGRNGIEIGNIRRQNLVSRIFRPQSSRHMVRIVVAQEMDSPVAYVSDFDLGITEYLAFKSKVPLPGIGNVGAGVDTKIRRAASRTRGFG